VFLSQKYSFSRHQAQKLIDNGLVLVNGKIITKSNFNAVENDRIQIEEKKSIDIVPNFAINLDVIFEHEGFLIINKQAGILVHPVKSREAEILPKAKLSNRVNQVFAKDAADTLVSALIARYPEIKSIGGGDRPGIVHRLDQGVSGLMVIARNQEYCQYLLKIFAEHKVIKKYYALIYGQPKEKSGIIDLGIGRTKRGKIIATQYAEKVKDYKTAITKYKVIRIFKKYSFVEIETLTGRTNQIRAHFKAIGHSLVGDELYGSRKDGLGRIFLHAFYLNFVDLDGMTREFVSPLPGELDIFLNKLTGGSFMTKLFILSGLSGAGKDTVLEGLKKDNFDFDWVVTTTTRSMRDGESEGRPYRFVSRGDFEKMIKNNELLEWADVYGNYYGSQTKDVEGLLKTSEKPIIFKTDYQGARTIKQKFPEAQVIFLVPSSLEDLERRIRNRGQNSEEDIQKRLAKTKKEMGTLDEWDHVVINQDGMISEAVNRVKEIILKESRS